MVKIFGTQTMCYHWTTFLQLNTFWFLLHFPNPLILSEPPGPGRNDSKFMFEFIFEDILPVIACRRFWTDLFAICGNTPSRRIQSPTTHYQKMSRHVRVKPKQKTRFARLWSGEWKFLWRQRVMLLHLRRSSSSDNFALMSLGTHI